MTEVVPAFVNSLELAVACAVLTKALTTGYKWELRQNVEEVKEFGEQNPNQRPVNTQQELYQSLDIITNPQFIDIATEDQFLVDLVISKLHLNMQQLREMAVFT